MVGAWPVDHVYKSPIPTSPNQRTIGYSKPAQFVPFASQKPTVTTNYAPQAARQTVTQKRPNEFEITMIQNELRRLLGIPSADRRRIVPVWEE